jgi:hypothetical protein
MKYYTLFTLMLCACSPTLEAESFKKAYAKALCENNARCSEKPVNAIGTEVCISMMPTILNDPECDQETFDACREELRSFCSDLPMPACKLCQP